MSTPVEHLHPLCCSVFLHPLPPCLSKPTQAPRAPDAHSQSQAPWSSRGAATSPAPPGSCCRDGPAREEAGECQQPEESIM